MTRVTTKPPEGFEPFSGHEIAAAKAAPPERRVVDPRRRFDRRAFGGARVAAGPPKLSQLAQAIEAREVTIDDVMNDYDQMFDPDDPRLLDSECVRASNEDVDRARCKSMGQEYVSAAEAQYRERHANGGKEDQPAGYKEFLRDVAAAAQRAPEEPAQVGRGLAPKDVEHGVRYQAAPDVGNFSDEPNGPPEG